MTSLSTSKTSVSVMLSFLLSWSTLLSDIVDGPNLCGKVVRQSVDGLSTGDLTSVQAENKHDESASTQPLVQSLFTATNAAEKANPVPTVCVLSRIQSTM